MMTRECRQTLEFDCNISCILPIGTVLGMLFLLVTVQYRYKKWKVLVMQNLVTQNFFFH